MIKNRWEKALLTFMGILFLLTAVPTAMAQGDTEEGFTLEEITVTAAKREENQQKVAISMEVLAGEDLKAMGRYDVDQILSQVSTAFISRTNEGMRVAIRGVGFDTPAGYGDGAMNSPGTVSVNFDGVFTSKRPTGTGLYDIDRVEVLFGPQSTVYASNAPGGIVNIETARPKLGAYEGYGTIEYGNYETLHGEAAVNAPITGDLSVRAAVNFLVHEGYLSNGTDDEDSKSGRLRLLYAPGDRFSFLATGEYEQSTGFGFTGITPFEDEGDVDDPWETDIPLEGTPRKTTKKKINTHIDYDFGFGVLTMIPAFYRDDTFRTTAVEDPFYLVMQDGTNVGWGEETGFEARLASPGDSSIAWNLGFNWYKGENESDQLTVYRDTTALPAGTPDTTRTLFYQNIKQKAFLGNITYPLTSRFRAVAGLRYSDDSAFSTRTILEGTGDNTISDMNHDGWNYKLGVEYDTSNDIMIYANWATSYRVEGEAMDWRGNAYDAQENRAYTLGSKMRFMGNHLQVNASAFYYDYINRIFMAMELKPAEYGPGPDEGGRAPGDLESYGLDLQTTTIITPNDKLNLSVSYLHAEVTRLVFDYQYLPDADYSNRTPTFSPDWTVTLDYSHNFVLPNGANLMAKYDTRFQTEYDIEWKDSSMGVDYTGIKTQEAHHIDNIGLVYTSPDQRWNASAYCKNIWNYAEKRFMNMGPTMNIGPPRTYGFTLSINF
jgi:iron complex outermembrane receptor protein